MEKPELFEQSEALFWNDPYISKSLLQAHLDSETDAASRKHSSIDKEVEHLLNSGLVKSGFKLLDLGCGPGLYAKRFAAQGVNVTGVDLSQNSLDFAKKQAQQEGLDIEYVQIDFFDMQYSEEFDVILQTNGELNTFSDSKRDELLNKLHNALKPDGVLIFDATTRSLRQKNLLKNGWYVAQNSFWRSSPQLVLEQGYDYPDENVYLNRHLVLDESGLADYRFWFHDYSLVTIQPVIQRAGLKIIHTWNDLTGTPHQNGGDWLAIAAKKT